MSTGYFQDINGTKIAVSTFTAGIMRFIEPESLIRFIPPEGSHYMQDNTLMSGAADHIGSREYAWTKVISVVDDGTVVDADTGLGPIVLNDKIPSTSKNYTNYS